MPHALLPVLHAAYMLIPIQYSLALNSTRRGFKECSSWSRELAAATNSHRLTQDVTSVTLNVALVWHRAVAGNTHPRRPLVSTPAQYSGRTHRKPDHRLLCLLGPSQSIWQGPNGNLDDQKTRVYAHYFRPEGGSLGTNGMFK
ncbi:hypothetical protein CGRA01v4_10128 [Colletotrichum graminicola]|nr:hypothetical protein CGRA01v4_10128 [Colletotrichum graminicola]